MGEQEINYSMQKFPKISPKKGWWVMAKCDAFLLLVKQIESKYIDTRATLEKYIHMHTLSHSLFSSYYTLD
jgi:hypothetical protein